MEEEYFRTSHLVYKCQYHVIFCPKYRRKVLTGEVEKRLKELILQTAEQHSFHIVEMEVMPDHVHLLISCNPRYGIMQCVKDIKQATASSLRREFPSLKTRIPNMWTRSVFIASVGENDAETVKKYIASQKGV